MEVTVLRIEDITSLVEVASLLDIAEEATQDETFTHEMKNWTMIKKCSCAVIALIKKMYRITIQSVQLASGRNRVRWPVNA